MDKLAINGGPKVRTEPFPQRTPFGKEEEELVVKALRSQIIFRYKMTEEFEAKFAEMYGMKYGIASTSGTAALHVAVGGAVNPNPGDEIITAPITDLGTIIPILSQNAIPIFADIDRRTYNMDPADVEAKITDRTRAILVVHLFGNACDIEAMVDIAKRHNLLLIEDCSQAHVTEYKGKYLGTWGDIGCYSLQQSKHMTTGDGGMTITDDPAMAERMALFADKGYNRDNNWAWGARSYLFHAPCYRITELQSAVGLAQLKKVKWVVNRRHDLGTRLTEAIKDIDGLIPAPVTEGCKHTYWSYAFEVPKWDMQTFGEALAAEGISASGGYIRKPIFICSESLRNKVTYGDSHFPFDSPYTDRKIEYNDDMCPVTQEALDHMITTGFHENFSDEDIDDVAAAIRKVATLLPTTK
ncbi:MAG: DegT/DnrJ/EryC1/StrS family aminotransferase [Planctomycetia bacterium]|nr:DegT/DnrJ/EryC1/StrS family aminotransferase [Planctomycetia bacterium]